MNNTYMIAKKCDGDTISVAKITEVGFEYIYNSEIDINDPLPWEHAADISYNINGISNWPHENWKYNIVTREELETEFFLELI